jgi:hypothetical protein
MEIDAPAQAVAVWIEGDKIMVRLPDHQLFDMQSPIQLMLLPKIVGIKAAANDRRDQSRPGSV